MTDQMRSNTNEQSSFIFLPSYNLHRSVLVAECDVVSLWRFLLHLFWSQSHKISPNTVTLVDVIGEESSVTVFIPNWDTESEKCDSIQCSVSRQSKSKVIYRTSAQQEEISNGLMYSFTGFYWFRLRYQGESRDQKSHIDTVRLRCLKFAKAVRS